jgi:tetratricopeptide (TPR) repeat protein
MTRLRAKGAAARQGLRAAVVAAALMLLASPAAARTLVLPFENAGREPRVFWLGEGSAVLLSDDLGALGVPVVTRDERRDAMGRLSVPASASLSHATVIRLGQSLAATEAVIGEFELSMGQLTVRARHIRLDTGRITPAIEERGPLGDIFGVYARVARRLAPDSRVTLEAMEQGHPPLPAFEVYVKGLLAEAPAARLSFLNQAMKLAPEFQRARIALWAALTDQGEHQRALLVARQVPAEHRFGRQGRMLAGVSLLHMRRHQESHDALRALQAPALDAAVANNLGVVQLRRPANAPGGPAITFFEEARRLDPADTDILFNLGYAHWLSKDVISAANALREVVRRNPGDAPARYVLGVVLQAAGNTADGAREKDAARKASAELAEWAATQASGSNAAPPGLERVKTVLKSTTF